MVTKLKRLNSHVKMWGHILMEEKLLANPSVVLREEFDDWALLFDPESGEVYGINPVSVFIWKCLDGKHTADDIVEELKKACEELPQTAREDINSFLTELVKNGLAGTEA
jgi:SynChlorMet cassette protein ScmD